MIPYIIVALWPFVMMYFYIKRNNCIEKPSTGVILMTALPMFLLIAFRSEMIGADTLIYSKHFVDSIGISVAEMLASTRMEVGYIIFVKLVSYITASPKIYQIICASVYMIGFVSFAKQLKGTDSFLFFYFVCTLGLFMFFFTGVRQCLAISICLYSYQFLIKKKYWIVVILILLAYFFHKSSLLFLVTLFVWNRNLKWYNYILYIVSVFFIGRYLLDLQLWVNENFDYNYEIENVGGGQIFLALLSILTVLSYNLIKRTNKDAYVVSLFNINIITLIFWILRLQTRVAERPSFYFLAFSCALFATCINRLPRNNQLSLYRYLVIIVTLVLYVYRLVTNYASFVPYSSFL